MFSYAIQGIAACFIERIEGCYYNIMGFPLYRFCQHLRETLLPNRACPEIEL